MLSKNTGEDREELTVALVPEHPDECMKLADRILMREFGMSSDAVEAGFALILQNPRKSKVRGQVDDELPDGSRAFELSAHQTSSELRVHQTPPHRIAELPDGSMKVDGHPLFIADRALLRRFSSPVRADGSKTMRCGPEQQR